MPHAPKISREKATLLRAEMARGASVRSLARREGVDPHTVRRATKGTPERLRKAGEFKGGVVTTAIEAPRRLLPIGSWTLETIRDARDDQMRGYFRLPVRLAEAMRTDDALFVAYHNRLAPHTAIATTLDPCSDSARAIAVCKRAAASVFCPRAVLEGAIGTMANHGIAIMHIRQEPNDEGTRVDFHITEWPLEFVRWNHTFEALQTQVRNEPFRIITHGDGEWIIIRKFEVLPWTQEACLLPAAMLWAGHAYGLADWAQTAKSHGQAKLAGMLPSELSLQQSDGDSVSLTPEARAIVQTMQDMVTGEAGAGLFPNGTELEFLANGSNAWQVFSELILNREKGAARIYQGTDAAMGSQGGAPGVDISILFGVSSTKVQGDFEAVQSAINTGAYQPWTAINEGDSRYAPRLRYLMPDPDAEQKSSQNAAKRERLFTAIKTYREQNLVLTQEAINAMAKELGVEPVPQLGDSAATQLQLSPEQEKAATLGRELRAALGLPPFGDARDNMTAVEIEIAAKGRADANTASVKATTAGQAQVAVAEIGAGVPAGATTPTPNLDPATLP